MARRKRKNVALRLFTLLLWLITLAGFGYCCYTLYNMDVIPEKYYYIAYIVVGFLLFTFFTFLIKRNTRRWIFIFNIIIFILILGASALTYFKFTSVVDFLNKNLSQHYETNVYYFLVNSESKYTKLEEIENETISLVNDINDKESLEKNIQKKFKNPNIKVNYLDSILDALYDVEVNPELILLANSGNYDAMVENFPEFEEKVRNLGTLEIQKRVENKETGIDMTQDAFVVYLSGIDTRSGTLPANSLSDVNILMAIDPIERNILMVHIPRDFYVPLHGMNGSKDKLTHAGLVGGINMSKSTVEDLFDIDILYYVRVNFNAAIKLVDAVGGITIYSDQKKTFKCWTDQACKIKPGNNNVDGRCALAFARERYTYKEGDRHRGENQEQVIRLLIEKITKSETILLKSSDILESLNGTFESNISTEEIMGLVKMQLNDMSGWNISTYNVSGTDGYGRTYSYPKQDLYVMIPDTSTIEKAKAELNKILIDEKPEENGTGV